MGAKRFMDASQLAAVVASALITLMSTNASAANQDLVDWSCPTEPTDQPTIFPEGTEVLELSGVIHIKDHSHNYKLTYTPHFDPVKGYYDNIVIVGRHYTLDSVTQTKTFIFGKDEFTQQAVDIPFAYCRSHRVPYQRRADQTLGQITIEDGSGNTKSARVRLDFLLVDCRMNGFCYKTGIGAKYEDQAGELGNVLLGQGRLKQDLNFLER